MPWLSSRRRLLGGLLPLALLAAACDPCTGVGSCTGTRVRYQGELTRGVGTGMKPVAAASIPVEFVRTGGVALESDTIRSTTDGEGRFILEVPSKEAGAVVGDLLFHPPAPLSPVRVPEVRMLTTRAAGDLHHLGAWTIPYPYFGYQYFFYYRVTGKPATGIEVIFRRTSGIPITPDTIRMLTDPRGYVILRPGTTVSGEVVGDLTVNLLPPRKPLVLRDVKLRTFLVERYDSVTAMGIGARLPYSAIIVSASTGKALAGVEVEFQRTGGVHIYPERFVTKTNEFGTVYLDPTPLETGELRGNVIIRPPTPGEEVVIRDLRLPTVEDDRSVELLGFWGVPGL